MNVINLFAEVELDKNRTWCPRAGCDTVCLVDVTSQPSSSSGGGTAAMISVISPSSSSSAKNASMIAYAVKCPTCEEEFCSACKKPVSLIGIRNRALHFGNTNENGNSVEN